MIKLAVQCRCRQCDQIRKILARGRERIASAPFRVMRTMPGAFAAVDAELRYYKSSSVPDADRLGRTSFQAGETAAAFILIQINGMIKLVHVKSPAKKIAISDIPNKTKYRILGDIDGHGDSGADADLSVDLHLI